MTADDDANADYREVFGKNPEPWRAPLGALRLTLAGDASWTLERARGECEEIVRILNGVEVTDESVPLQVAYDDLKAEYAAFRENVRSRTPQPSADPREVAHIECDCVPDLGPSHCHLCGERAGHPISWDEAHPTRPSADLIVEAKRTLAQHDRVWANTSRNPLPTRGVSASLRALIEAAREVQS